MFRNIFLSLCALLSLAACSDDGPHPEDVALQAAKAYYDQLLHGDYDSFVEGTLHGDTLVPSDFRSQLLLNARQFIEQQQENHKGISSIETVRATCDTITLQGIKNHEGNDSTVRIANAFLAIHYADSTREEIVVPMIELRNVWYMK